MENAFTCRVAEIIATLLLRFYSLEVKDERNQSKMTNSESCLESFISLLGYQSRSEDHVPSDEDIGRLLRLERSLLNSTSCVTVPQLSTMSASEGDLPSADLNRLKAMGMRIQVERSSVSSLPKALLDNVVMSFEDLLDTRLQRFTQFLLSKSMRTVHGAKASENTLAHENLQAVSMLVNMHGTPTISISHYESTFRALPMSKGFVKMQGSKRIVIIPFVLTVKVFTKMFGIKTVQLGLTAPGTVVGIFSTSDNKIDCADVQIDSARLLKSMKRRCDQVVKKAYETSITMIRHIASQTSQYSSPEGSIRRPNCTHGLQA